MTELTPPVLLWFREDLRVFDNPSVAAACATGRPIIAVYIYDPSTSTRPYGAAQKWWLHHSIKALDETLRKFSSRLIFIKGNSVENIIDMVNNYGIQSIYSSHIYDQQHEKSDHELIQRLRTINVSLHRFNANHMIAPGTVKTQGGGPFSVFTPYYRALTLAGVFATAGMAPVIKERWPVPVNRPEGEPIEALGLLPGPTPSGADWSRGFSKWHPGERGARKAFETFLSQGLKGYTANRDRVDISATSGLSAHLRFGEISLPFVLQRLNDVVASEPDLAHDADKFRAELAWREFSYEQLRRVPDLHTRNVQARFDTFPWKTNSQALCAWKRGQTGYPLIDAAMRQLWTTGLMHNRMRMITASFLTKHLLIHWRDGEQWFWDCLLDADPASNPANWQWVAGCGADAAPYFRIFNPISSADKFDPRGVYRTTYLPPSTQIRDVQSDLFGVAKNSASDSDYPKPIVEHAFARQRALAAFEAMRQSGSQAHDGPN